MTPENAINYNSASCLRAFLEREGLGMRKKFGQNFLINPSVRQALVDALDARWGDEVWEVGPGLGAMTALLLEKGFSVKAFEIDPGFIGVLKKIFCEEKRFSLIEGDVMKTWSTQEPSPFFLGNLPYNVGASLLADLIEKGRLFTRMAVTVQKEVALRMAACAGTGDYSSFSVLCQSAYKVKPLMLIRPSSFYPRPNVDSMGVLLESRPPLSYPAVFYPLVRSLFSSRRKTIKNNLTGFLSSRFAKSSPAQICASILAENSLSGNERAENLDIDGFLSLAKSIDNVRL
jgi:16S rRNA (adenine1518-N6/adenine1519-N6)-dimethyltransferase